MRARSRAGIAVARTIGERTSSAARRAVASGRVPASGPLSPQLHQRLSTPAAPRAPGSARAASSRPRRARARAALGAPPAWQARGRPVRASQRMRTGPYTAVTCRSVTKTYLFTSGRRAAARGVEGVLASRVLHVDGSARGLAAVVAMHARLRRAALTVSLVFRRPRHLGIGTASSASARSSRRACGASSTITARPRTARPRAGVMAARTATARPGEAHCRGPRREARSGHALQSRRRSAAVHGAHFLARTRSEVAAAGTCGSARRSRPLFRQADAAAGSSRALGQPRRRSTSRQP
jgi:hypothetical protein